MPEKMTNDQITSALGSLPGWSYDGSRAISREFTFDDHIEAMGFLTRLAMAAEVMNHHPEIEMVYNRVKVTLSTHDAGGVTSNDTELAKKADAYG